uniref:Secreted protein n=1 Tax=Heligmosomoides polygyrus TaxID=6339 RepID=A0A183GWN4_HELPZ
MCSFYNDRHKDTLHIDNVPPEILSYKPPQKIGIFYQIKLYDGTRIVVPELHITTTEFLNKNDFCCFDTKGKSVPVLITATTAKHGSSAFCRQHSCSKPTSPSVFCLYYSPVTTFDTETTSVIVRA